MAEPQSQMYEKVFLIFRVIEINVILLVFPLWAQDSSCSSSHQNHIQTLKEGNDWSCQFYLFLSSGMAKAFLQIPHQLMST